MSWNDELSKSMCSARELGSFYSLSDEETAKYEEIIKKFPMLVTPYYLSLVDKNDPDDPIAKMCIPSEDEMDPSGTFDTSGEGSNTKQVGVQHKYEQTALILSTNICAMYCRHCFRKRLVGLSNDELLDQMEVAANYVREHPEINNVLISGGDALMNPNNIIEGYLQEFSALDNLDLIRLGSRVPVTFPERIYDDPELLNIISKYAKKKALVLVTQFNHPREVTEEAKRAVSCFIERGVSVRNQAVLLKGVNDDPEVLVSLFRALTRINVIPYYLFQCRPVTGVKHRFQVPVRKAVEIIDEAKSRLNGLQKTFRYAMSHPAGKIEILGSLNEHQMLFKFHQSKDPDDSAMIFTVEMDENATWLDDELNAI